MVVVNFRQLMFDLYLNQDKLAKYAGVTQACVCQMRKRGTMKRGVLKRLETALGRDLDRYVVNDEEPAAA